MAKSYITDEEKNIGKTAAKMLAKSLQSVISSKNFKSSENPYKKILLSSTTEERMVKKYPYLLNGIALKMPKHGFVQNYGVNTTRIGNNVRRTKPRTTEYQRKAHPFQMKATPFIDEAVEHSGAVEYLSEKLPSAKSGRVLSVMKYSLENGK